MFSRSRATVVSEDTDVLVLLLHYFEKFHSLGLQNLLLQLGKGEKRRMLPVHIMFERFGKDFCQEILSAHLATGSDHLSQVGSKRCALTADPEKSLCNFGKTAILDEDQLKVAEEYLVNVLSSSNGVKTFDELRVQVHKKTDSALGLPPTSYSIRNGHIRRWWYLLKESSNLLTPEHERCLLNALEYGWEDQEGDLYANKQLHLIPDELCNTCRCKTGCKTKHCSCVKAEGSKCSDFCLCINCENK